MLTLLLSLRGTGPSHQFISGWSLPRRRALYPRPGPLRRVGHAPAAEAVAESVRGRGIDRRLISRGPILTVGVKTWGELIEENRARLQFFQEQLQHTADESSAIRYLQEKHSNFLEGVFLEEEIDGDDNNQALDEVAENVDAD
jgi:hypothetical protein